MSKKKDFKMPASHARLIAELYEIREKARHNTAILGMHAADWISSAIDKLNKLERGRQRLIAERKK